MVQVLLRCVRPSGREVCHFPPSTRTAERRTTLEASSTVPQDQIAQADNGSGNVQPGASASSPSDSGETSLTPDASSADTLPTAAWTIQRQLSAYLTGPHDHEEQRVGWTRADEQAARRAAAEEAAQAQETAEQSHGTEKGEMKEG